MRITYVLFKTNPATSTSRLRKVFSELLIGKYEKFEKIIAISKKCQVSLKQKFKRLLLLLNIKY